MSAAAQLPELSYVEKAALYIDGVLSGAIPACELVKLACERQLNDLIAASENRFPYRFNTYQANRVCQFIETLPHVKGKQWAGKNITLEPWQCFIWTTVYGWVDKQGQRRFKVAYIEVPRKNSKSTQAAGVGVYGLVADGELGAEIVTAATGREQARIVFDVCSSMVKKTPKLRKKFGVEAGKYAIYVERTMSSLRALARDSGGNLDGLNISLAIIDELHAHKTRDVWDAIDTGTGARDQSLILAITTAGVNFASICYEQNHYSQQVLRKILEDEQFFCVIYTIDKDDLELWDQPKTWQKANPNYGVSVNPTDLIRKARAARSSPKARSTFMTKHLNIWVGAAEGWMNMIAWRNCEDKTLRREDFIDDGCNYIIGLDLASKRDFAARIDLFARIENDGKYHFYVFPRFYLPEARVRQEALTQDDETDQRGANNQQLDMLSQQYAAWAAAGDMIVTSGNVTDLGRVRDEIKDDAIEEAGLLLDVGYDPHQATLMVNDLLEEDIPMTEYRQTVLNMSEPMKEVEALVIDGRLHHNGNAVMTWMISNVVCHEDAKDNIYPRKPNAQAKIDGAIALIIAKGRWIAELASDEGSIYDEQDGVEII